MKNKDSAQKISHEALVLPIKEQVKRLEKTGNKISLKDLIEEAVKKAFAKKK